MQDDIVKRRLNTDWIVLFETLFSKDCLVDMADEVHDAERIVKALTHRLSFKIKKRNP